MFYSIVLLKDSKIDPHRVDLILHNTQLKKLVIKRIREYNVSPLRLMATTSIRYDDLKTWLTTNSINRNPLSHYDILKLCGILNIKLRVQLIIDDSGSPDRVLTKNVKYDREQGNRIGKQSEAKIAARISETTGIDVHAFGIDTDIGENNPGSNICGDEEELPQGDKAFITAITKAGIGNEGIPEERSGNLDTRYEIWRE